jgi:hypothetical protein
VPLDRVWSLTPRELALALESLAPVTDRMSRRDFEDILAAHPDPTPISAPHEDDPDDRHSPDTGQSGTLA